MFSFNPFSSFKKENPVITQFSTLIKNGEISCYSQAPLHKIKPENDTINIRDTVYPITSEQKEEYAQYNFAQLVGKIHMTPREGEMVSNPIVTVYAFYKDDSSENTGTFITKRLVNGDDTPEAYKLFIENTTDPQSEYPELLEVYKNKLDTGIKSGDIPKKFEFIKI